MKKIVTAAAVALAGVTATAIVLLVGADVVSAQSASANAQTCLFINMQRHATVEITVDEYPGVSWTWAYGETGTVTIDDEPIHSNRPDGAFTVHVNPDGPAAAWYFNAGPGFHDKCDGTWWMSLGDE